MLKCPPIKIYFISTMYYKKNRFLLHIDWFYDIKKNRSFIRNAGLSRALFVLQFNFQKIHT